MSEDNSQQTSSLLGESIRGVIWSLADRGGSGAISVLVHIVLARLLVPEYFGVIAMARVGVELIGLFNDLGFAQAIIQRDELEDEHLDSALWSLMGIGLILSAVGYVASPLVALFFDEPQLEDVFKVLVLQIPIMSASAVPVAILKRRMRFKVLSVRSLFAVTVAGGIAIGLAFLGWGVWALVAKSLIDVCVGAVVLWAAVEWRPRVAFSKAHFRDLFSFGANITGAKFVNFFTRQADDLIIGYFLGSTALGFYSVAYEILQGLTSLLARTMTSVALPAFSRLQHEADQLRKAFVTSVSGASLLSFPVFLLFAAVAPEFFEVIYGDKWIDSAPIAQILAFVGVLHTAALFNPPIIKARGRADWAFLLSLVNAVGNVAGFFIGVTFGVEGVAIAFVAWGYLFTPFELVCVHRLIDFRVGEYLTNVGRSFVSALGIAAAVRGLGWLLAPHLPTWVSLGIMVGVGLLGHYLFVRFIVGLSITDLTARLREELGNLEK
ncbi:MAG: lipopolysaccharide biosynthesis protein [Persicimonas sp.]